jgi:hypothetical protein
VQGYDAFKLMHIRAAHDWQNFDLVGAHAFERQIKPLVGVDVGDLVDALASYPEYRTEF